MTPMGATDKHSAPRSWAVVLLLVAAGGCGDSDPGQSASRPAREQGALILVVSSGPNDPYNPVLEAGARRVAKRIPATEVRFVKPEADTPSSQAAFLLSLREPKLAGVCVHPHEGPEVRSAMDALVTRGLTVVSILEPGSRHLAGHVGLDDEAVGRALAAETAQAIGGQGQVMLLHAGTSQERYRDRLRSFEAAIRNQPGVEVLASLDCSGDPYRARALIADHAARYPRLSAWVSLADWPLRDSAKVWPLPESARLVTVGGAPPQWPLVESGRLARVVGADCSMLAEHAVDLCESSIRSPSGGTRTVQLPMRVLFAGNLKAYRQEWVEWSRW